MGNKHVTGSKTDHKSFSWRNAKKRIIIITIISIVLLSTIYIAAAEQDIIEDMDVFNLQIKGPAPPVDLTCPTCQIGGATGAPGYLPPGGLGGYTPPSRRYGSSRIPELIYTREILKINTPIISSFFSYMFPPGFGVPNMNVFSPPVRSPPPGLQPITNASKPPITNASKAK